MDTKSVPAQPVAADTVDLSSFENSSYDPGRPKLVRALWFFLGLPILRSTLIPSYAVRRLLLRAFGADIAPSVAIKPGVRVKYPWLLKVGAFSWLGEDCWIDNLAPVTIGSNCCISQGAFLCTGNHDWSDRSFRLIEKPITVGDGAWIGARAFVGPGIQVGAGAVLTAGAVATKDIPPQEIHGGNPASFIRRRDTKGRSKVNSA